MKTCRKGLHQYEPVPGSDRGCLECRALGLKNNPNRTMTKQNWRKRNPQYLIEYNDRQEVKDKRLFKG